MKLPTKLTLGNKPKKPNLVLGGNGNGDPPQQSTTTAQATKPQEETKQESSKYSSAEVKLMMIAIEDLHKNRFKNGWFTMIKFTEQVEKKPEVLDELKKFSDENTIEPDEWTEPVVVFNKQPMKPRTIAAGQPKQRMKLNIGVEDDGKMLPNPHSKFPPPQKPIPQQQQPPTQQAKQSQAAKKPPGLSLSIKGGNSAAGGSGTNTSSPPKVTASKPKLQLSIGGSGNGAKPPQQQENVASQKQSAAVEQKKKRDDAVTKIVQLTAKLCDRSAKKQALGKVKALRDKPIGAAKLISCLEERHLRILQRAFTKLEEDGAKKLTNELFGDLDESLQSVGQKVKQFFPGQQTQSNQLNKINLLCVQGLQEKLDRAASLYTDYTNRRAGGESVTSLVEMKELSEWTNDSIQLSKVQSTVKLVCILNRYSFTNKRVLRLMRIWERVRIENEMQLLVKELTTIGNQFKVISLLHLNQYCKDRLSSVFYTWLANCSSHERPQKFTTSAASQNSGNHQHLQELFLRSANNFGNHRTIRSFFFSPAKRQSTTQKMISQKASGIQFPQSTGSQGASFVSSQQKKQLKQQIQKQKELAAEKQKNRSGSFHKQQPSDGLVKKKQSTPSRTQNLQPSTGRRKQSTNKSVGGQQDQSTIMGLNMTAEQDSNGMLQDSEMVGNVASMNGQKTATNRRPDSSLKLLSTDPQAREQMPQPLLSQQYKSGNQNFDMLREHLQLQAKKLNLSDISETTFNQQQMQGSNNNNPALKHHHVKQGDSLSGQQLIVSELRTNGVLTLIKFMVFKGKQQLELNEHLNYLKQLKIKRDMVVRATGTYNMTQTEAACLQNSDQRIKGIVLDQWKLFTHYKVRQETHKNIVLTKMLTLLANKRYAVQYEALHSVSKYTNYVIREIKRKKMHKSKISPEQRYGCLTVGLDIWNRVLKTQKRKRLVKSLLQWKLVALFANHKEEIEHTLMSGVGASGRESRQQNIFSQRSARQNDPQKLLEIKQKSQQIGAQRLEAILEKPRRIQHSKKREGRTYMEAMRCFKHWRMAAALSSRKGRLSKTATILKKTILRSIRCTALGAFRKWKANTSAALESCTSEVTTQVSDIEALDQALLHSQSLIAARMQASLSEKTKSIKTKAKDQALKAVLTRQILHKQPNMKMLNVSFKRWKTTATFIAQKNHQKDWQNEQIQTVLKEKQVLEKKVEDLNDQNEELQADISQVLIQTECQDCKQKQLKMTMLRSQSSHKRIGQRIDTDGAVSEYWDMESSQASAQLENIGRFTSENDLQLRNDSSVNLDSQMVMINDPGASKNNINRQGSMISQILDTSDPMINATRGEDGDSSMILDDLNLDQHNASKDLFLNKHPSSTSMRRQQTDLNVRSDSTGKMQKILSSNQTISSGAGGDDESAPSTARRFSELMIEDSKIKGRGMLLRKNTQKSATSSKRVFEGVSLNSTGVVSKRGIKEDALSQLADPQNLETTNEELKQELIFVKAEIENKYDAIQQEKDQFLNRLAELKRRKEEALQRIELRKMNQTEVEV